MIYQSTVAALLHITLPLIMLCIIGFIALGIYDGSKGKDYRLVLLVIGIMYMILWALCMLFGA